MNVTLNSIQPVLHEVKLGLEELYGDRLVKLILFGSHARDKANLDMEAPRQIEGLKQSFSIDIVSILIL